MAERVITSFAYGYTPDQDVNAGADVDFSDVQTNSLLIGGAAGVGTPQYALPPADGVEGDYMKMAGGTAVWGPGAPIPDQGLNTGDDVQFKSVEAESVSIIKNAGTASFLVEGKFPDIQIRRDDHTLGGAYMTFSALGGGQAMAIGQNNITDDLRFNTQGGSSMTFSQAGKLTTKEGEFETLNVIKSAGTAAMLIEGKFPDVQIRRDNHLVGGGFMTFSALGGGQAMSIGQDFTSDDLIFSSQGGEQMTFSQAGKLTTKAIESESMSVIKSAGTAAMVIEGKYPDLQIRRDDHTLGGAYMTFSALGGGQAMSIGQSAGSTDLFFNSQGGAQMTFSQAGVLHTNGVEAETSFKLGAAGPAQCSFPMDVSTNELGDQLFYDGAGAATWKTPNRQTLWSAWGPGTITATAARQNILSQLVSSKGSLVLPIELLNDPANLGRSFTLSAGGRITTTNAADVMTVELIAKGDPGATYTTPIGVSPTLFDLQTPEVNVAWESIINFKVCGVTAGVPEITVTGRFMYSGDSSSSGYNAIDGACLQTAGAGGAANGCEPLGNGVDDVELDLSFTFDAVDANAIIRIDQADLTMDAI